MVASVGTILVAPGDGDMRLYLASVARLAALNARVASRAHGPPIDAPTLLFERYIEHRRMREERVYSALPPPSEPAVTSSPLVPRGYDDTSSYLWPLARLSVEAHLAKLVEDGRARESEGRFAKC
jgi:ribonuclease/clavin/mitogillin